MGSDIPKGYVELSEGFTREIRYLKFDTGKKQQKFKHFYGPSNNHVMCENLLFLHFQRLINEKRILL